MIYTIHVEYQTGDSFSSYETSTVLDYDWTNLEIVKENLQRIKNHSEFTKDRYNDKQDDEELPIGVKCDKEYRIFLLCLLTDKKEEKIITWPNWCGYFENLHSIEIKTKNDKTMRIEF